MQELVEEWSNAEETMTADGISVMCTQRGIPMTAEFSSALRFDSRWARMMAECDYENAINALGADKPSDDMAVELAETAGTAAGGEKAETDTAAGVHISLCFFFFLN